MHAFLSIKELHLDGARKAKPTYPEDPLASALHEVLQEHVDLHNLHLLHDADTRTIFLGLFYNRYKTAWRFAANTSTPGDVHKALRDRLLRRAAQFCTGYASAYQNDDTSGVPGFASTTRRVLRPRARGAQ